MHTQVMGLTEIQVIRAPGVLLCFLCGEREEKVQSIYPVVPHPQLVQNELPDLFLYESTQQCLISTTWQPNAHQAGTQVEVNISLTPLALTTFGKVKLC